MRGSALWLSVVRLGLVGWMVCTGLAGCDDGAAPPNDAVVLVDAATDMQPVDRGVDMARPDMAIPPDMDVRPDQAVDMATDMADMAVPPDMAIDMAGDGDVVPVDMGSDGDVMPDMAFVIDMDVAPDMAPDMAIVLPDLGVDDLEVIIDAPLDGALVNATPIRVTGRVNQEVAVAVNDVAAVVEGQAFAADVPLVEGENVLTASALDAQGDPVNATVTVTLDTTAPVVQIEGIEDGFATPEDSVEIMGTIDDADATLTINGVAIVIENGRFNADVPLEDGENVITIVVVDAAGNRTESIYNVVRDANAPALVINAPSEGAVLASNDVVISGTVTNAMTLTVGGIEVPIVDAAFTTQIERPDGDHAVVVQARSRAGVQTERTVRFGVDTRAPRVTIITPEDGSLLIVRTVDVTGTVDEDDVDIQVGIVQAVIVDGPGGVANFTARGVELQEGANLITVVATDRAGNQGMATVNIDVDTAQPDIVIESPAPDTLLRADVVSVTGRAVGADIVRVDVGGVEVAVDGDGRFTRENVPLEEGRNVISAAATDAHGNVGVAQVAVIRDTSPAVIRIETPQDGDILTSTQVDIAGICNDLITGVTVNNDDLRVWVNGQEATVLNRTFIFPDLLLQRGPNVITVESEDRAGNRSTRTIRVTVADRTGQRVVAIAGNGQTARVGDPIERPLIVSLLNNNDDPVPNSPVTFTVTRGDGEVVAFPKRDRALTVNTDDNGLASVQFAPGARAGAGSHRVTVTSPGYVGKVEFCTSVTAEAPHRISMVKGDGQTGATGKALPEPFIALVVDEMGNSVEGVEVEFSQLTGNGVFEGGAPSVRVRTDSDGLARAVLTLGAPGEHGVVAAYAGLEGDPAKFRATATIVGPRNATRVVGVVLDNQDRPLDGTTAWIRLDDGPILVAEADANGRFAIENVPVGPVHLVVDASTANRAGSFPSIQYNIVTVAGIDNTVGRTIYLPENETLSTRMVGGDADVELRIKGVPGAELRVFANSVVCPDGEPTCELTWSQVRGERVPDPPPLGSSFSLVWTLQPSGVRFDPPARVCVPNEGHPIGQQLEIFSFDHDLSDWVGLGTATVIEDGTMACSDGGFGIFKSGWGGAPPPPPPPTCVGGCDDGNPCTSDSCVDGSCQHDPIDGGQCDDGSGCGSATCEGGTCVFSEKEEDGTACDDNSVCTENDMCEDGACVADDVECDDDGNDCTDDYCEETKGGCVNEPKVGATCDDAVNCTENDVCDSAGECAGEEKQCEQDDENECAESICNEDSGECEDEPRNTGMECGDQGDEDDPCGRYECLDDATCGPPMGQPNTDGMECDDEDECTEEDVCKDGKCAGEKPDEDFIDTSSAGFDLEVPQGVITGANNIINRVPGLGGVRFNDASFGVRAQAKTCCNENSNGPIEKGQVEVEASFSLGFAAKNLPIGPWSIQIDQVFDFGVVEVDIIAAIGPFWDAAFSIGGSVGRRQSECEGEDCFFGSGGASASLGIKLLVEVIACIETLWTDERCRGLTFQPVGVSASVSGNVNWGKPSCDSGFDVCVTLGKVVLSANLSLDVPGSNGLVFEREVYGGLPLGCGN